MTLHLLKGVESTDTRTNLAGSFLTHIHFFTEQPMLYSLIPRVLVAFRMVPSTNNAAYADIHLADHIAFLFSGGSSSGLGSFRLFLRLLLRSLLRLGRSGHGSIDIDLIEIEIDMRNGQLRAEIGVHLLHVGIPTDCIHVAIVALERVLWFDLDQRRYENKRNNEEGGEISNSHSSGKSDKSLSEKGNVELHHNNSLVDASVHSLLNKFESSLNLHAYSMSIRLQVPYQRHYHPKGPQSSCPWQ